MGSRKYNEKPKPYKGDLIKIGMQKLACGVILQAFRDKDYDFFGSDIYDFWASIAFGRTSYSDMKKQIKKVKEKKK